ncbi:MAG: DsbA family protein [Pseudomonadota bacterium]
MARIVMTRRASLMAASATALSLAVPVWAQDAEAPARSVEGMVLGDPDAPVTVIEYASLTCPHCASFHRDVFKRIKTNYIDTGKVRFVVRDVYFDRYGLWAAMVARCAGPERYFGIVDRLFERQDEWSRQAEAADAVAGIFAIGRQAGMTDDQMDACVQDQAWAEALVAEYQKNAQADEVQGTPTFFINGRKESNMNYRTFATKLDEALGS